MTASPSFYRDTPAGRACRGCDVVGPHAEACPLLALRRAVQEVGAQLGLYVATVRELLDEADRVLRDEGPGDR